MGWQRYPGTILSKEESSNCWGTKEPTDSDSIYSAAKAKKD